MSEEKENNDEDDGVGSNGSSLCSVLCSASYPAPQRQISAAKMTVDREPLLATRQYF